MVVVILVGILAAIGVASLRQFANSSRTTEAMSNIQAIRAAQEKTFALEMRYLNVSPGAPGLFYPQLAPSRDKYAWLRPAHVDYPGWLALDAPIEGPVVFAYRCSAGAAATAVPVSAATGLNPMGSPAEPWYQIEAIADTDEDGVRAVFVATSWSPQVYSENQGE